jgi:hypothetical protein
MMIYLDYYLNILIQYEFELYFIIHQLIILKAPNILVISAIKV